MYERCTRRKISSFNFSIIFLFDILFSSARFCMDQNFIKIFMRSNFIVGVFYCVTILGMERSEKNNAEVAFNTLKTHFCAYYASEKLNNAYGLID